MFTVLFRNFHLIQQKNSNLVGNYLMKLFYVLNESDKPMALFNDLVL
jgi:hypothetical protein